MLGRYAVALVTLNRAAARHKSICDTVYEPNQFSWTKVKQAGPFGPAWEDAKYIARNAPKVFDITHGATYFHERSLNPRWAKTMTATLTVGNHVFYKSA